ncbi:MAG: hypothetical protein OXS32_10065, partial [Verrucomicrobiales bacterium]|nr:hypothetical protein [Verrucomicrobiales bacterium]
MMITTTLAKIRAASPCESGYRKLVKHLGGVTAYGQDTPINLSTILSSNGLDDALWCLPVCEPVERRRYVERKFCLALLPDPDNGVLRHVQGEKYAAQRAAIEGVIALLERALGGDE